MYAASPMHGLLCTLFDKKKDFNDRMKVRKILLIKLAQGTDQVQYLSCAHT